MPLQVQTGSISFFQGLDTKTDPLQLPPAKLLQAENVVFGRPGRLGKRNGSTTLSSTNLITGSPILAGTSTATFLSEFLVTDSAELYSYDRSNNALVPKGTLYSPTASISQVTRTAYAQTFQDEVVHSSGLALSAWVDSSNGGCVRYCVRDTSTGQVIVPSTLVVDSDNTTTLIKPKTLVIGNTFVLLWYNTTDTWIAGSLIPVGAPQTPLDPHTIVGSGNSNIDINASVPTFDATVITTATGAQQLYVAFNDGTNNLTVFSVSTTALGTIDYTLHVAVEAASTVISIFGTYLAAGTQQPLIAWFRGQYSSNKALIHFAVYDPTLTTEAESGEIIDFDGANDDIPPVSINGVERGTTEANVAFFASFPVTWPNDSSVSSWRLDNSYDVSTGPIVRSVQQSSKAFVFNGTAFFLAAFGPTTLVDSDMDSVSLQPGYYAINDSGVVVGRVLYGNGGGIPVAPPGTGSFLLSEVTTVSPTAIVTAVQQITQIIPTPGTQPGTSTTLFQTTTGVSELTLDFQDNLASYSWVELGRNLVYGGSCAQMYDGISPTEVNFNTFPDSVLPAQASGSNLYGGQQYNYCAVYSWTDNQGQVHRSTPSPIALLTTTGSGAAYCSATVKVPTQRLTAKDTSESPIVIEVYRTAVESGVPGDIFYLVTSLASPLVNDPTVDFVTFPDTVSDATLIGNIQLYTTGGVLPNYPPNPLSGLCIHYNRIVGIDTTNPSVIWYSKQWIPGTAPEFALAFTLNIDPRGGPVTALQTMDANLIVFKEDSIFYVQGAGPDPTGVNNQFPDAVRATTDTGCSNERSIVAVPNGLMFQSPKGFYLLDHGLNTTYVGADVQKYNGQTCTSAVLMPTRNEVRFTLAATSTAPAVVLVYNYFLNAWSTFTGNAMAIVDSVLWNDLWTWIQANGTILQETPGLYTDSGQLVKMTVLTAWQSLSGLQGYQRIYKILVLGTYRSPHTLQVSLAFDLNPNFTQTDLITPQTPDSWGSDPTWGALGTAWGGPEVVPYQWRVFPTQQKCQSFQVQIQDFQATDPGESLTLSALGLEFGTLGKLRRLPAAQSVG